VLRAGGERGGDVEGERQVAAGVAADLGAVHGDAAGLVDRAEVQQDAVPFCRCGQREAASVPERLVGPQRSTDP